MSYTHIHSRHLKFVMRHNFICNLSDDELILLRRHGDEYASYYLYTKYKTYTKKIASILFYKNKHYKDVHLEDYEAMFENCFITALKNYKVGSNYFKAYWEKIISNDLNKMFVILNKKRYLMSHSLDSNIKEESDTKYYEIIGSHDHHIKNNLTKDEICQHLLDAEKSLLDDEERIVVIGMMFNKSLKSIAKRLNCDVKHVRYVFYKAKLKLECLKNNH